MCKELVGIIIRKYKKRDLPAMRQIFYDTIHTVCAMDYTTEELDVWAPDDAAASRWVPLGKVCLVAEEQGRVLGFADMERDGYVNRFYTHKDHLRRGVGAALMAELAVCAKKWHLSYIKLEASRTAIPFYEKMGFRPAGTVTRHRGSVVFHNQKMIKFL